jgi:hypothetical protein
MDLLGAVGYSKTVISHPSKYFSSIPKKFIQRKNIMLCDILSTYYCVSAKGIQRFLELDAQHPTLQPTRHEKCKEIGKILVTAQKKWGALLNKKR